MAQMTALRRRMSDDMTVRNLSPATQQSYVYAVAKFSRFFRRSPDQLRARERGFGRGARGGRRARRPATAHASAAQQPLQLIDKRALRIVARSPQRRRQLRLEHFLDERADLVANPGFNRVEPICSQEWNPVSKRVILRHGVISAGGVNRRSLGSASGDYATSNFPPLLRRDPRSHRRRLRRPVLSILGRDFLRLLQS
jgi:hypothetical protein